MTGRNGLWRSAGLLWKDDWAGAGLGYRLPSVSRMTPPALMATKRTVPSDWHSCSIRGITRDNVIIPRLNHVGSETYTGEFK
jgi:hypothetical protein